MNEEKGILIRLVNFIWGKICTYAKIIDELCQDFLGDLKSFRIQLVYWAWAFTFLVLWKAPEHLGGVLTLLGVVYGFYFSSKLLQHKLKDANTVESEPVETRDPDEI